MKLEYNDKGEPKKRHDFKVSIPTGFFGLGVPISYKVRMFTKVEAITLTKEDLRQIWAAIFRNIKLWADSKSKEGYTKKTVLASLPNSDIYIKKLENQKNDRNK